MEPHGLEPPRERTLSLREVFSFPNRLFLVVMMLLVSDLNPMVIANGDPLVSRDVLGIGPEVLGSKLGE